MTSRKNELAQWRRVATWADFHWEHKPYLCCDGIIAYSSPSFSGLSVVNFESGCEEFRLHIQAEPIGLTAKYLLVQEYLGDGEHELVGFDVQSGHELWRTAVPKFVWYDFLTGAGTLLSDSYDTYRSLGLSGHTHIIIALAVDDSNEQKRTLRYAVCSITLGSGKIDWWRDVDGQLSELVVDSEAVIIVTSPEPYSLTTHLVSAATGEDLGAWPFESGEPVLFDSTQSILWIRHTVQFDLETRIGTMELIAVDAKSGATLDVLTAVNDFGLRKISSAGKVLHVDTDRAGLIRWKDGERSEYPEGFHALVLSDDIIAAVSDSRLSVWDTGSGAHLYEILLAVLSDDPADTSMAGKNDGDSAVLNSGDLILWVGRCLVVLNATDGALRQVVKLPAASGVIVCVTMHADIRGVVVKDKDVLAAISIVGPARSEVGDLIELLNDVTTVLARGTVPLGLGAGRTTSSEGK